MLFPYLYHKTCKGKPYPHSSWHTGIQFSRGICCERGRQVVRSGGWNICIKCGAVFRRYSFFPFYKETRSLSSEICSEKKGSCFCSRRGAFVPARSDCRQFLNSFHIKSPLISGLLSNLMADCLLSQLGSICN